MTIPARYVHTNLIARDWQALARFYEDVFGCVPVPPERDLSGPEMEPARDCRRVSGGIHLRLPGYGDAGPTLEVFSYDQLADQMAERPRRRSIGPASGTCVQRG